MRARPCGVSRALACSRIGLLVVRVGRTPDPQGARSDERGWDLHLARHRSVEAATSSGRSAAAIAAGAKGPLRSAVVALLEVVGAVGAHLHLRDRSGRRRTGEPEQGAHLAEVATGEDPTDDVVAAVGALAEQFHL